MPDPQDRVEIAGIAALPVQEAQVLSRPRRRWLSIWFTCCKTYGRIYQNSAGTKYEGRCPHCGASVRALVGEGGTSRRMFETR